MAHYDAIVIGAGQPGQEWLAPLADDGKRVTTIEMDRAGGTCLNHGCKPTKALRASASVAHQARRARIYGVNLARSLSTSLRQWRECARLSTACRRSLDNWLASVPGLDQFHGQATVVTDPAGEGHHVSVDHQNLSAQEALWLNLGARATRPPIPARLGTVEALTEVELLALDSQFQSIC